MPALRFSVVIPTFDRPAALRRCLQSLQAQRWPAHLAELIVVDDGGSENPSSLPASAPMAVRIIRRPHEGPAAARNAGLATARGEYIAFTDDDCCPSPDWLAELDRAFTANPAAAIGGHTENSLDRNVYASASQTLIDYLYRYQAGGMIGSPFFTSNNLAFPTKALREIGGFDPVTFRHAGGEDRDVCERWSRSGRALIFERKAVVAHYHGLRLRTFLGQHFRYGRGAFHFHRNRAAAGGAPRRMERPAFYWGMLAFPFLCGRRDPWAVSGLLASSQVANAAGYFTEKMAVLWRPQQEEGRSPHRDDRAAGREAG